MKHEQLHLISIIFYSGCPVSLNLQGFEEAMTRRMDKGHSVDVIYLDFAKAFDSVNYRFLLAKMKAFGLDIVVVR